jgi:hypothetical protein
MNTTRFNPFPKVSSPYGAPMGRCGGTLNAYLDAAEGDVGLPLSHLCVSEPQGEYDAGGAYWGLDEKEGPVFAVWWCGHGHEGVVYVRARSGDDAKRKALDL